MRKHLPVIAFSALMAVSLAALLLLPSIPQDQRYHQFADQRTIFGIPNFWNVVSNLPFLAIGFAGLGRFRRDPATAVFFLGVFLTGFGSSYYHWDPNDSTLFWDRLPMTLSFAAVLALLLGERVSPQAGAIALWPVLAIGVFSLLLWRWTDDLRLYFWVQFFGVVLLTLFLLYPAKYTGTYRWIVAGALYALAKLFELTDAPIFYLGGGLVSGHTLKHLAAAAACFAVLCYFQTRRPIRRTQRECRVGSEA